jgi:MFS family permease
MGHSINSKIQTADPMLGGPHTFKRRHGVLILVFLLAVITYLDRVCIAVSGPRMQDDLHIDPRRWGWALGVFALSYAAFEIPSGWWGDRKGPRRVLTRIVGWWSVFTGLTGAVSSYPVLLFVRFAFGAGEAGAFPNASVAIARWFPRAEQSTALGLMFTGTQIGGALAPFIIIPLQAIIGWRATFGVLALIGCAWAAAWFLYYRDQPNSLDLRAAELAELHNVRRPPSRPLLWKQLFASPSMWLLIAMWFANCCGAFFFLSWLQTYLVRGRGFTQRQLLWSTAPLIAGAVANALGGHLNTVMLRIAGWKWGRRTLGIGGLIIAASSLMFAASSATKSWALTWLSVGSFGLNINQPTAWAVCVDVAGEYAGAVSGTMNTAGQIGSFASATAFGYLATWYRSFDAPLFAIATVLVCGALVWLLIDPTREILQQQPL